MKRWPLYLFALGVLGFLEILPFQGTDVARLEPIEAVWLTSIDDTVYLETDTGDVGIGEDISEALEDMKNKAFGAVFIETADYLIIEQGKEELLSQAFPVFRPSCMVCVSAKKPDLMDCAEFLTVHESTATLRQLRAEKKELPELKQLQGRFELIE